MKTKTIKRYKIIDNLDDHLGYNGEDVTIHKELSSGYFLVINENGNTWQVGEEEITEIL